MLNCHPSSLAGGIGICKAAGAVQLKFSFVVIKINPPGRVETKYSVSPVTENVGQLSA